LTKLYIAQNTEPFVVVYTKKLTAREDRKRIADSLNSGKPLKVSSLVSTSGKDFPFTCRQDSIQIFVEMLYARFRRMGGVDVEHMLSLNGVHGSGKSRFLDELENQVKSLVLSSTEYDEEFKAAIMGALFINISFDDLFAYSQTQGSSGIADVLCYRILSLFCEKIEIFIKNFIPTHTESLLDFCISNLIDGSRIVILGVDDLNKLCHKNETDYNHLVFLLDSMSRKTKFLFCPILSGTDLSNTNVTFFRIPLPLLDTRASENLFSGYLREPALTSKLKQVISDMGGNCRSLELLSEALIDFRPAASNPDLYLVTAILTVRSALSKRYVFDERYDIPICYSFLPQTITADQLAYGNRTFLDLSRMGLIQLERNEIGMTVKIPFIFVTTYMLQVSTEFTQFWTEIFFESSTTHQLWERFNRNHLAFKLSLFKILGREDVLISELLRGSVLSIPEGSDKIVGIPDDIRLSYLEYHYPTTTNDQEFSVGECVLNGETAPSFDAFLYLSTVDDPSDKLLLAMQMKYSYQKRGQKVTNMLLDEEYSKANNAISRYLPGTDFVFLMLCRSLCATNFTSSTMPSKVALVSRDQMEKYYGAYFDRLDFTVKQEILSLVP
jgi:hypothetical protein